MNARSTRFLLRGMSVILAIAGSLAGVGCSTNYAVPGQAADLKKMTATTESLTDSSINTALAKVPLAKFPCGIAAVRIQAPGYHSESAQTFGTGNYCVITTRDIESDADIAKLAATEHGAQLTNGWMTEAAVNDARKRTETKAFAKLVDGLQGTWQGVLMNSAKPAVEGINVN